MRRHARKLEHFSMWLMVFGVASLCQPWVALLHSYSVLMILSGLIMFNVFSRFRPVLPGLPPTGQPSEERQERVVRHG